MKPEDAIKIIKVAIAEVEWNYPMDYTVAFEEAIMALEKQVPKQPKEYEDKYYTCPNCGNVTMMKWGRYPDRLMDKSNGLPYCLCCGQYLDWEGIE